MRKLRSDALKTRSNLLEAAAEIFSKKGFWAATNDEICKKAKASRSINYYFGSKENLYIEAWKYAYKKSIEKYPFEGGALPNDPAEKKLRGRVLSILKRIADPESYEVDIMLKELTNPTGLLEDIIAEGIESFDRDSILIIKELMCKEATAEQISLCYMSIISSCYAPMIIFRPINKNNGITRVRFLPLGLGVEKLADYIVRLALAGIRSFNRQSK